MIGRQSFRADLLEPLKMGRSVAPYNVDARARIGLFVPAILPGICLHGGGPVADIFDVANLAGLSQRCAGGFVAAERHRAFPDEAACIAFHSA